MKRIFLLILFLLVSLNGANINKYKDFRSVPLEKATLLEKGKNKMFCNICGMNLPMFYKTNHASKHKGKEHQYCSIVCLIEDMIVNNKKMDDFRVIDNSTLKFIPSKSAYFIVGSKKPGTMSIVSKYAFGTKKAALKFQKENGGDIFNFTKLVDLVKESQAKNIADTKKKQLKIIKKGALLYKKMCKQTDNFFTNETEAKLFIKNSGICGDIKGKELNSIGLYLKERGVKKHIK